MDRWHVFVVAVAVASFQINRASTLSRRTTTIFRTGSKRSVSSPRCALFVDE